MFTFGSIVSFQPHQVFLPLGHFASVLTGVRNTSRVVVKNRREAAQDNNNDCVSSLLEAEKNCKDPSFQELCKHRVWEHFESLLTTKASTPEPWTVCHTSSKTFFENKYGFPESDLLSPRSALHPLARHILRNAQLFSPRLSSCHLFSSHVSFRGFKTRSQQSIVGIAGSRANKGASLGERFLDLKVQKDKDLPKLAVEAEKNWRAQTLISDENLTPEEQTRLKVAFAEGYISANPKDKLYFYIKIFDIVRGMLIFALVVSSFVYFMVGGTINRFLMGANEVRPEDISVTFEDVKGVEAAKQELQEVVEFLRNPDKFSVLGGKLPKGLLLVGPPGTGKTLLARAVAGEANVPFFHIAGPEFDEVLVGQGARRVRDLFNTAKVRAPCVIFIDEIDSVGAKRSSTLVHPYANQTINQLLTEMDGFRQNEGVIVLGATNRRDDLDKALLRPGRFDVEVQVPLPDLVGRKEILNLYLGKVKVLHNVDIDVLGRGTTGFTGADLENMVNQAALRAAIDGASAVSMAYLENARDKILMGPERKSRIPDDDANCITAYHEGGHALVAFFTKDAHPLHKVTIIPRGPSLGHTAYIPAKEQYHVTRAQMLATMDTLMGGRAAEELIFGAEKVTTGASSDLKQATALATHMVKDCGMSEKVGVRTFESDPRTLVTVNELAASTSETIDTEIKRLLNESYERAKTILRNHNREHKLLAEALLKYETLDVEDIQAIMSGGEAKRVT